VVTNTLLPAHQMTTSRGVNQVETAKLASLLHRRADVGHSSPLSGGHKDVFDDTDFADFVLQASARAGVDASSDDEFDEEISPLASPSSSKLSSSPVRITHASTPTHGKVRRATPASPQDYDILDDLRAAASTTSPRTTQMVSLELNWNRMIDRRGPGC
jgi:hypothetical protein